MTDSCKRLHELAGNLETLRWPFPAHKLPPNGIYFFYEEGETWGHGGKHPRMVRVGTHRDGNFSSRMADHFVDDPRKLELTKTRPAPKDRSIFRKNLGRALLNQASDPYLRIWDIDFTSRATRDRDGHRRDLVKEQAIEQQVSQLLRERFTLRWIAVEGEARRMGTMGLERRLIGTLSACRECGPSSNWLGVFSPKPKIAESGLWLEQHLSTPSLSKDELTGLEPAFLSVPGGE